MTHKLEGRWRVSNIVLGPDPVQMPTNDGFIYLNVIDPVTGEIIDAFHRRDDIKPIQGQITDTGSGYAISMKHDDGDRIRRYQGMLAFESPVDGQLVIFARTYTLRPNQLVNEVAVEARATPAIEPPQDDGTVIITRP
jgi:hypothetical protein